MSATKTHFACTQPKSSGLFYVRVAVSLFSNPLSCLSRTTLLSCCTHMLSFLLVADFITALLSFSPHTHTHTHKCMLRCCTPCRVVFRPDKKCLAELGQPRYITPSHCSNSGLSHSDGTPGCGFLFVCVHARLWVCACVCAFTE